MNELALYAGVGGGILGGILCGFKTICAVEIESYCREVLFQRQRDGVLPMFPIWDDVKTFDGRIWNGEVDIITAGFPCQPFLVAGKREGDKDERNMWPDTIRIIREVRPHFALLENVPGILVHPYFGTVLGDLAESGYDCKWSCLGADDVGANHMRKRLWILAYPNGGRYLGECGIDGIGSGKMSLECICKEVADTESTTTRGLSSGESAAHAIVRIDSENITDANELGCKSGGQRRILTFGKKSRSKPEFGWWDAEPTLGRVAHGVANRVDRLKAIGNGQVSLSMAIAFHKLFERYHER